MGLFDKARAWLPGQLQQAAATDNPIVYVRGAESIDLTRRAWVGRTVFSRLPNAAGAAVVYGDRDYLIPVAALPWEPQKGDRIEETVGEVTLVYDVLPPGGEPAWRYSDPGRTVYRVHCKQKPGS